MFDWFSSWTPEAVVGLVTAISSALVAWWAKGKFRAATNPPTDRDMMSSVRLHPEDLKILEALLAAVNVEKEIEDVLCTKADQILLNTEILLDRGNRR